MMKLYSQSDTIIDKRTYNYHHSLAWRISENMVDILRNLLHGKSFGKQMENLLRNDSSNSQLRQKYYLVNFSSW